jgi:hypothetical protein
MNLEFSDEQTLLRDSVARFVKQRYSLERRNAWVRAEPGFDADNWRAMSELGWLSLPFSEADGGLGGSALETMIVMEQFGKGLVVEPFFASIVLGGGVLKRCGSQELKDKLLPGVMDGSLQLALAHSEEQARFDLENVATTARAADDGFVLNGIKSFVLNAGSAAQLVVSARTSGNLADEQGITLFLVDARSDGVALQQYPTVDGLWAAEVSLKDVHVSQSNVLGAVGQGFPVLNVVAGDAILALSAEALGAMEVLYQDTVQYTQQRVQFNHPLADFQVLQHRMVEMFMEYELARSMLYRATMEVSQGAPRAQQSVHALKHFMSKAGAFVAENAVQLHGGMGMTEELRVGHFFKRLLVIDLQFGNGDYHLRKFAAGY